MSSKHPFLKGLLPPALFCAIHISSLKYCDTVFGEFSSQPLFSFTFSIFIECQLFIRFRLHSINPFVSNVSINTSCFSVNFTIIHMLKFFRKLFSFSFSGETGRWLWNHDFSLLHNDFLLLTMSTVKTFVSSWEYDNV